MQHNIQVLLHLVASCLPEHVGLSSKPQAEDTDLFEAGSAAQQNASTLVYAVQTSQQYS